MGADAFGRDLFSRVLYWGRTTMLASLCVVVIGAIVGTSVGLIAGFFGGALGFGIMRLVDLLLAFPGILLALTVTAILGPGLSNGVIAIAVILVPVYARLVEGATAEVRNLPFVDVQLASGWGRQDGQNGGKRHGTITPRTLVGDIGRDLDLGRIRSREQGGRLVGDPVRAFFQRQGCGPCGRLMQQKEHLA
jgi:hypothetical protein